MDRIGDIELRLLLEALYLRYHYDFRGYARSSLRRRLRVAMDKFECSSLSQLQHRILRESRRGEGQQADSGQRKFPKNLHRTTSSHADRTSNPG